MRIYGGPSRDRPQLLKGVGAFNLHLRLPRVGRVGDAVYFYRLTSRERYDALDFNFVYSIPNRVSRKADLTARLCCQADRDLTPIMLVPHPIFLVITPDMHIGTFSDFFGGRDHPLAYFLIGIFIGFFGGLLFASLVQSRADDIRRR
jgi:hypothetical protein